MTKRPIPNNLRAARKTAGLRQREVASLLKLNCTDRISRWENGAAVPHILNLFRLAVIYKTKPESLYPQMWSAVEKLNSWDLAEAQPLQGDTLSRPG